MATVCFAPQWRVHFEVRVEAADFRIRKAHVVRGGLCGDIHASRLGSPDDVYSVFGGNVLKMNTSPCLG